MAIKAKDRVYETSTTTGTGTYTLDGAVTGFQAFSAVGANNYCPYFATDGTNWEVGLGKYVASPDRLERTTVWASSNGGSAVNWSSGTRDLRCGFPAELMFRGVTARSSDTVLGAGDCDATIAATGTWTQTFDAAANLGNGWNVYYHNDGTGTITLDPSSTEQIDGASTIALQPGEAVRISCNGSAFKTTRHPLFRYGAAVVQTTGEVTLPLQSAFLAYNQATDADQTGDATTYTVAFDAEVFDQNADFNTSTSTFTAPVTGRYQLSTGLLLQQLSGSHTTITLRIVTSNRNFEQSQIFGTNPYTSMSLTLSVLADMDAADTATVTIRVSGSTKTVDVYGDTAPTTFFSGHLAC